MGWEILAFQAVNDIDLSGWFRCDTSRRYMKKVHSMETVDFFHCERG